MPKLGPDPSQETFAAPAHGEGLILWFFLEQHVCGLLPSHTELSCENPLQGWLGKYSLQLDCGLLGAPGGSVTTGKQGYGSYSNYHLGHPGTVHMVLNRCTNARENHS